jgi:uncharacterized protein with von Willebrand factor type A (vWA) domain
MSYLNKLTKGSKKKDSRTKQAIKYDRWDLQVAQQIRREVKDYVLAEQDLSKATPTGIEAMNDTLFSLYKARPELVDSEKMRPSHTVNRAVMDELLKLPDYEKNRPVSVGDPIGTGLACASIEPHLEVLFDKLEQAQQMAQKLDELISEYEALETSADDLMKAWSESSDDEAQNYQDQIDKINEALEALKKNIEDQENDLNEEMESKRGIISKKLKDAMNDLSEANSALEKIDSWGLHPGGVRKMPPESRLELAKKLRTEKFKKMADVFGRMQSIAAYEQTHKVNYTPEEIYELEQGADLHRVVPVDMLNLSDDILVYDWLHRFVERNLIQYSLRGDDSVVKGGIILLEDGSSSMAGTREIWAKGIGLALLKIASMQHRPFNVINFAGPGNYICWDFDTSKDVLRSTKNVNGKKESSHEGISAVVDYAETNLYGGTNFETPFAVALDILAGQHDNTGSVDGDIVFLTDGECGMSQEAITAFKAEQARLGFNVYGIAIETNPKSEPMNTLCDGSVIGLKQLTDVNDISPLFGKL